MIARDTFLFIILCAYLIGSLPTNTILQRAFHQPYHLSAWEFPGLREHYPEFILNILKGMAALTIARYLIGSPVSLALAGLAVIIGHFWPAIFPTRTRPGFGVLVGVLVIFSPQVIPALILIWYLSYFSLKSPYLSNYLTIFSLPAVLYQFKPYDLYMAFGIITAFLVSYQLLGECPRRRVIRRTTFALIFCSVLALGFFSRYVYKGFGIQHDLVRTGTLGMPYVAITFDDGPDPLYTPAILDILAEHNIKATFFMVGRHVEEYPEIARRIVEEGHDIGNHTYSHRSLVPLHPDKVFHEIIRCEEVIEAITGKRPHFFRPPRGVYSQVVRDIVQERGYTLCLWTISSQDWREISSREVTSRILDRLQGGEILLFHDSGNLISAQGGYRYNTVRALPGIIAGLEEKGLVPVSMQEFMILKGLTHTEEDV